LHHNIEKDMELKDAVVVENLFSCSGENGPKLTPSRPKCKL